MSYWNRDNFEGLKSIGETYSAIENYQLFGTYCQQKEQGLKKLAIASIKQFISHSKSRSLQEQREITEELSSLSFHNRNIHLLSHPLTVYLKEVLTLWASDEPNNPTPHKWLGYITADISSYEKSLQLSPNDEICIYQITQEYFRQVDYQTHHLSESLFIGNISHAKHTLHLALSLIETLHTETIKSQMQDTLEYFNNLLNCWEEYSQLNIEQPFPQWCASKGEKFNFWSVIYYDQ